MVSVVTAAGGGVGAVGGVSTTLRVQAQTRTDASATVRHLDNTPQLLQMARLLRAESQMTRLRPSCARQQALNFVSAFAS
jgi:hypothetical protein